MGNEGNEGGEITITEKEMSERGHCLRRIEEIEEVISSISLSGGDNSSYVEARRVLKEKAKEEGWG
jgi:hypothetical protein